MVVLRREGADGCPGPVADGQLGLEPDQAAGFAEPVVQLPVFGPLVLLVVTTDGFEF
jgi:hypothetical protein